MRCPYCGAEVNVNVSPVCEYCDSDLSDLIPKPEPAADNWRTGQSNAQRVYVPGPKTGPKSKKTALLLCCLGFFGVGGVHRLYVGKIGTGLLYIFTYGLFFLGTIVDLALIAGGVFTDSNGEPLE
ncbi:MAG: TM2 domain-containing protein [Ruminococcus sp.]|nr:TM2 domain-containing protein [Ruminococcus sp.]